MSALVELIRRLGIFMIAAQAVIHFAPGQKYEKYIKLIVGMLILLQFVMPIRGILNGAADEWSAQAEDMARLLETEEFSGAAGSSSIAASVVKSLENEIKSKLNNEILGENIVISNVQVFLKAAEGESGARAGTRQYEFEKVRVAVYRKSLFADDGTDMSADGGIEKIQIEKIDVSGTGGSGSCFDDEQKKDSPSMEGTGEAEVREEAAGTGETANAEEMAEQLRKRFCSVLGMEEEKMEVSIYGTNEKTG